MYTYDVESHISHSQILFPLEQLSFVVFWCSRIQCHIQLQYFMPKAPSERMCVCSNSLKPLGQLKPNFMQHHHGIKEKMESLFKWFRSFVVIHYCRPPGAGAFSTDFTTNLATQCRAFSRALKIEKIKSSAIPWPEGAGDTNDWCFI